MLEKLLGIGANKQRMPRAGEALPGRDTPMQVRNSHHVHGRPIQGQGAVRRGPVTGERLDGHHLVPQDPRHLHPHRHQLGQHGVALPRRGRGRAS